MLLDTIKTLQVLLLFSFVNFIRCMDAPSSDISAGTKRIVVENFNQTINWPNINQAHINRCGTLTKLLEWQSYADSGASTPIVQVMLPKDLDNTQLAPTADPKKHPFSFFLEFLEYPSICALQKKLRELSCESDQVKLAIMSDQLEVGPILKETTALLASRFSHPDRLKEFVRSGSFNLMLQPNLEVNARIAHKMMKRNSALFYWLLKERVVHNTRWFAGDCPAYTAFQTMCCQAFTVSFNQTDSKVVTTERFGTIGLGDKHGEADVVTTYDAKTQQRKDILGQLNREYDLNKKNFTSACFNKEGDMVVAAHKDASVYIMKLNSNRMSKYHQDGPINNVAFSNCGKIIASASDDGNIVLHEIATGQCKHILSSGDRVRFVRFTTTDTLLVSYGVRDNQSEIKVWDVPSGTLVRSVPIHSYQIMHMALGKSGTTLAILGSDRKVHLYNIALDRFTRTFECFSDYTKKPYNIAISDTTNLIAVNCNGQSFFNQPSSVRIFNATTGEFVFEFTALRDNGTRGIAFSNDGTKLAVCCVDNKVRLFNLIAPEMKEYLQKNITPEQAALLMYIYQNTHNLPNYSGVLPWHFFKKSLGLSQTPKLLEYFNQLDDRIKKAVTNDIVIQ